MQHYSGERRHRVNNRSTSVDSYGIVIFLSIRLANMRTHGRNARELVTSHRAQQHLNRDCGYDLLCSQPL